MDTRGHNDADAASEMLRTLASRPEAVLTLRDILVDAGSRVHGLALLLLVIPETLPLPLPSASAILGVPLVLISAHLAVFGEKRPLPNSVAALSVSRPVYSTVARNAARLLSWIERFSHHRWGVLAGREHVIGLVCVYLSVILLLLPIPFFNAPPAICLALLALGLIQRDGAMVAAGFVGTAAVTAAFLYALVWAKDLIFQ